MATKINLYPTLPVILAAFNLRRDSVVIESLFSVLLVSSSLKLFIVFVIISLGTIYFTLYFNCLMMLCDCK